MKLFTYFRNDGPFPIILLGVGASDILEADIILKEHTGFDATRTTFIGCRVEACFEPLPDDKAAWIEAGGYTTNLILSLP